MNLRVILAIGALGPFSVLPAAPAEPFTGTDALQIPDIVMLPADAYGKFLGRTNESGRTKESLLGLAWARTVEKNYDDAFRLLTNLSSRKKEFAGLFPPDPTDGSDLWAHQELLSAYLRERLGQRVVAKEEAASFVGARKKNEVLTPYATALAGRLALWNGDADQAVVWLSSYWSNAAYQKLPPAAGVVGDLAEAQRRTGMPDSARKNFMEAQRLDPDGVEGAKAAYRLALLEKKENPKAAKDLFSQILNGSGAAQYGYLAMRDLLDLAVSMKKNDEANQWRRQILTVYPAMPGSEAMRQELGRAAVTAGRFDEATNWFARTLTGTNAAARREVLALLLDASKTNASNRVFWMQTGMRYLKEFPKDQLSQDLLPELLFRTAKAARWDDATTLARALYSNESSDAETKREAAKYLIVIQETQKNAAKALEGYDLYFATKPGRTFERLSMLRDYLAALAKAGKEDKLTQAWQSLYDDARSVGEKSRAARELAGRIQNVDRRKAAALWMEAGLAQPWATDTSVKALQQALRLYAQGGDVKQTEDALSKIRLNFSDLSPSPVPEALLAAVKGLTAAKKTEDAKKFAARLQTQFPDSAEAGQAADLVK